MKLVEQLANNYSKSSNGDKELIKKAFIEGWYALNHEIGGLTIFNPDIVTELECGGIMAHEIVPRILNDIDVLTDKNI